MNETSTTPNHRSQSEPGPRRSLDEALSEVDREIKVRARCYDRWISEGKLSSVDARDRIERLQAALAFLQRTKDLDEAAGEPPTDSSG